MTTRFFRLVAGLLGALFATSFGQQVPVDKVTTFDVASVKASPAEGDQFRGRKGTPPFTSDPTRMAARHLTLKGLISRAYGIDESQVLGGPAWIDSDRYDIDAKVENPTDREHMLIMLQALLSDRFRLSIHRDTKRIQQYVLVAAKNGPKFGPHFHPAETTPNAPAGNRPTAKDGLKAYTMAHLAFFLSDNRDWVYRQDARHETARLGSGHPVTDTVSHGLDEMKASCVECLRLWRSYAAALSDYHEWDGRLRAADRADPAAIEALALKAEAAEHAKMAAHHAVRQHEERSHHG